MILHNQYLDAITSMPLVKMVPVLVEFVRFILSPLLTGLAVSGVPIRLALDSFAYQAKCADFIHDSSLLGGDPNSAVQVFFLDINGSIAVDTEGFTVTASIQTLDPQLQSQVNLIGTTTVKPDKGIAVFSDLIVLGPKGVEINLIVNATPTLIPDVSFFPLKLEEGGTIIERSIYFLQGNDLSFPWRK